MGVCVYVPMSPLSCMVQLYLCFAHNTAHPMCVHVWVWHACVMLACLHTSPSLFSPSLSPSTSVSVCGVSLFLSPHTVHMRRRLCQQRHGSTCRTLCVITSHLTTLSSLLAHAHRNQQQDEGEEGKMDKGDKELFEQSKSFEVSAVCETRPCSVSASGGASGPCTCTCSTRLLLMSCFQPLTPTCPHGARRNCSS